MKIFQGLSRKLIVAILLCSSLFTVILTCVQIYWDYLSEVNDLDEQVEQVQKSMLPPLTETVWVEDTRLTESQLEGIYRLPGISFVRLEAFRSAIEFGSPAPQALRHELPLRYEYKGEWYHLGSLMLETDLYLIYQKLGDKVLLILLGQLIKTFGVTLFIFLIFQHYLIKPIQAVSGFVTRIRLDRLEEPLPVAVDPVNPDEMDLLVVGIDQMRAELRHEVELQEDYRKRLEELNQQLEQRVKDRTEELEALNQQKDRFFSIISHDLKSPFNNILGILELLEEADQMSKEELQSLINMLRSSSNNIYQLLENLLDWARLQLNTLSYQPIHVDLASLALDVMELLKPIADKKQIRLQLGACDDVKGYADHAMIRSVFHNLIVNALKFTSPNGRILISIEELTSEVVVKIKDNGVGIPESILPKLFKIDEKVTTKGTNKEMGTGLGLILCKEMVEKNGGHLEVTSQVGVGSTFSVFLPKALGSSFNPPSLFQQSA